MRTGKACAPYDCDFHYASWFSDWTSDKKAWCCNNRGRGCVFPRTSRTYNCSEHKETWEEAWSIEKRSFCCAVKQTGCTPFDCQKDFEDWQLLWGADKREYCCELTGRGCVYRLDSKPIECSKGIQNWEEGWSEAQKLYCCKRRGIACTPYDCSFRADTWESSWSEEKQLWCCQNGGPGCATMPTTRPRYTCDGEWFTWSDEQRMFCCSHTGRGCQIFDCNELLAVWESKWSAVKKIWCCRHQKVGCVATTVGPPSHHYNNYDCTPTGETLQRAWSLRKRDFCCEHHNTGCPDASLTADQNTQHSLQGATQHFDCDRGFSTRDFAWSAAKRSWCCRTLSRGCLQYTCQQTDVMEFWVPERRSYCCRTQSIGCAKSGAESTWSPESKALLPDVQAPVARGVDWHAIPMLLLSLMVLFSGAIACRTSRRAGADPSVYLNVGFASEDIGSGHASIQDSIVRP